MAAKKHPKSSARVLWIAVLAVPGIAVAYGLGPGDWFGSSTDEVLEGAVVRRGPLAITVTERGNLEAKNKYSLKNEVEGRTTILFLIEEGTRVEKGDLIAELDATSLVDRLVQKQDTVLNARANLTKAKANLEIQETENESLLARALQTVAFAEIDLEKYKQGDWPQSVQEADENIMLAEAELKNAEQQYDWSERLEAQGFLTRTELEKDKLTFDRAKITVEQRKRTKELMLEYENPKMVAELEGNLEEAKRELKKVRLQAEAQLVDQQVAVQTAEARLKLEEKELAKLEDQIAKAKVYAPVAGMVVYGREDGGRWGGGEPVQEGGEVRERQELVSIPSSGDMIAEASIHESVLKQVHVGQEVIVRVDAIPSHEFRGRVEFVAMLPDKNSWFANPNLRLYKTEISMADETDQMRPGMSCNVEILVDQLEDTLYVPLQSVVHARGTNLAFVRSRKGIEPREVEIGPHNEKWVAIESGLSEGEVVLLAPPAGFVLDEDSRRGGEEGAAELGDESAPGGPSAMGSADRPGGVGGSPELGGGDDRAAFGGGEGGPSFEGGEASRPRGGFEGGERGASSRGEDGRPSGFQGGGGERRRPREGGDAGGRPRPGGGEGGGSSSESR